MRRLRHTSLLVVTAALAGVGAWTLVADELTLSRDRSPSLDLRVAPERVEPRSPRLATPDEEVGESVSAPSPEPAARPGAGASPRGWVAVLARAVHPDGTPIAGAEVELAALFYTDERGRRMPLEQVKAAYDAERDIDHEVEVLATVTAGPGGQVRLAPLEVPPMTAFLHVSFFDPASGARGAAPVERHEGVVDLGDILASRSYEGDRRVRLVVTVVRGGEPAGGAVVTGAWYWEDPEWLRIRADARGRVTLIVPPTTIDVMAEAPGEVAWRDDVLVDDRDVEITLELEPSPPITGVVLDSLGRPVPDAIVEAFGVGGVRGRWRGWSATRSTEPDGTFCLERLGTGPHLVAARDWRQHHPELVSAPLQLVPGQHAVLVVSEAATLRLPNVEGLRVERRGPDGRWLPLSHVGYRSDPKAQVSVAVAAGWFRLVDAWTLASSAACQVEPGSTAALALDVGPRISRQVTGRVVRRDGSPVPGAPVSVLDADGSVLALAWSEPRWAGERAGSFSLSIPERALTLRVDVGAPSPTTIPLPAVGDLYVGDVVVAPP